jgi:Derlin-2/3
MNAAQVNDTPGMDAWFRSLPLVTRYWLGASVVCTLGVNFGIINGHYIPFFWDNVQSKFELWRLLSCFLYVGGFSFGTLVSFLLLYQFSERYERGGPFNTGAGGGTADYMFMMMFLMTVLLITYPLMNMLAPIAPIFSQNLIFGVLYCWSRRFPTAQANVWGFPIPAMYVPFAQLVLRLFMGGQVWDMLHGMGVAHLYYFLADVVPQVQGRDVLHTPQFLIDRFGVGEYRPPAAAASARPPSFGGRRGGGPPPTGTATANRGGGGYNWGSGGQRLGRS